MIQTQDLFPISFYQKEMFHGSFRGMHYRIEKITVEETDLLRATVWPGPYNFDTTANDLKISETFEFSDRGLKDVCGYLNEMYRQKKVPQRRT